VGARPSEPAAASAPAKGRRRDQTFTLTTAGAEAGAGRYQSVDDALRDAARWPLRSLFQKWLIRWLDRVLAARDRGLDPAQIAAELGLSAEEVAFYLDPRTAKGLEWRRAFMQPPVRAPKRVKKAAQEKV